MKLLLIVVVLVFIALWFYCLFDISKRQDEINEKIWGFINNKDAEV